MQFSRRFPHVRQSGVTLMTPFDGRRIFVALTPEAVRAMDQFFASVPTKGLFV